MARRGGDAFPSHVTVGSTILSILLLLPSTLLLVYNMPYVGDHGSIFLASLVKLMVMGTWAPPNGISKLIVSFDNCAAVCRPLFFPFPSHEKVKMMAQESSFYIQKNV